MTTTNEAAVEGIRRSIKERHARVRGFIWLFIDTFGKGYSGDIWRALKDDADEPLRTEMYIGDVRAVLTQLEREGVLVSDIEEAAGPACWQRRYYRFAKRPATSD